MYAEIAQLVEHVLGKDEVTGSIPVLGSERAKRTRCTRIGIEREGVGEREFPVEEGLGKPWVSQVLMWCRAQTKHKEAKK